MLFTTRFASPLGSVLLACRGDLLVACRVGDTPAARGGKALLAAMAREEAAEDGTRPALVQARHWLGRYFAGERPDPAELALAPCATPFAASVRRALLDIPFGSTCTYGDMAARIARETGRAASPRAVGGAVGRNPIAIIVPCHRVLGSGGTLTGYAWGLAAKEWLLRHEGAAFRSTETPGGL